MYKQNETAERQHGDLKEMISNDSPYGDCISVASDTYFLRQQQYAHQLQSWQQQWANSSIPQQPLPNTAKMSVMSVSDKLRAEIREWCGGALDKY